MLTHALSIIVYNGVPPAIQPVSLVLVSLSSRRVGLQEGGGRMEAMSILLLLIRGEGRGTLLKFTEDRIPW